MSGLIDTPTPLGGHRLSHRLLQALAARVRPTAHLGGEHHALAIQVAAQPDVGDGSAREVKRLRAIQHGLSAHEVRDEDQGSAIKTWCLPVRLYGGGFFATGTPLN